MRNEYNSGGQPQAQIVTDVGYFSDFIDALEVWRDEAKIVFTDDSIYSKLMDPATVAMSISKISGRALNMLDVEGDGDVVAGVKLEQVSDCLTGISSTSEIEITYPYVDGGGNNNILLNIIDEDIRFSLRTIDKDTMKEMPQNDPISHKTQMVVSGNRLKKAIKHSTKIEDVDEGHINIRTEDDYLELSVSKQSKGDFDMKFRYTGPDDDLPLPKHESIVALSYFDEIKKTLGSSDNVTIHIKDENPVRLDASLDDDGDAKIIYIIAPRIDDN